jgi:hypothetical protein
MMRFFPRDFGSESDDGPDAIIAVYSAFLKSIPDPMGSRIRDFHTNQSLNTNFLDKIQTRTSRKEVALNLISGDQQRGYSLLSIRYKNAALIETESHIRRALNFRNAQIRYDEFDLGPGGLSPYVHRFLLWPKHLGEFAISFDDFDVEQRSLATRGYVTYGETFEVD